MLVKEKREREKICSIILYDWRQIIMMQRLRTHARSTKRRHQYQRERETQRATNRYVCMRVRMRARQALSDCIDLRRRLRRITFEFVVVDPHKSNNTRRLYWLVCKEECVYNSYTICLVKVFNKYTFLLDFFFFFPYRSICIIKIRMSSIRTVCSFSFLFFSHIFYSIDVIRCVIELIYLLSIEKKKKLK
jgi:hypothetical protein